VASDGLAIVSQIITRSFGLSTLTITTSPPTKASTYDICQLISDIPGIGLAITEYLMKGGYMVSPDDDDLQWVRALTVLMHLGLIDRSCVPHNLISAQESPAPSPKF
jgi:hypothetical protein